MTRLSFERAKAQFVNRYTLEHVPAWARMGANNGRHYAPGYRTDAEWYAATSFPGDTGGPAANSRHCFSGGQSWPLGHWLARPLPYADARKAATDDAALEALRAAYAWIPLAGFDGKGVAYNLTGYDGSNFRDGFEPRQDHSGPGWFVFARNAEKYGTLPDGRGAYVALVAWPDKPRRACPNYNGRVRRGWRTKREAQAVADRLALAMESAQ